MFQSTGCDCCCKKYSDLIWCFLSFSFVPSQQIIQGGGREGKREHTVSLLKKNEWVEPIVPNPPLQNHPSAGLCVYIL